MGLWTSLSASNVGLGLSAIAATWNAIATLLADIAVSPAFPAITALLGAITGATANDLAARRREATKAIKEAEALRSMLSLEIKFNLFQARNSLSIVEVLLEKLDEPVKNTGGSSNDQLYIVMEVINKTLPEVLPQRLEVFNSYLPKITSLFDPSDIEGIYRFYLAIMYIQDSYPNLIGLEKMSNRNFQRVLESFKEVIQVPLRRGNPLETEQEESHNFP
ncbi:MAG: hypothetical protein VKJ64_07380 [Leptolyngbyaceae bacterium]|nr:hypothetical protein [Leptolyngbyaceae bacterium]